MLRSADAAETAFAAGQLDKARQLLKGVPYNRRSWRQKLKGLIAASPKSVGEKLQKATAALARQDTVSRA